MSERDFKGFVEVSQLAQRGMITLRADLSASKVKAAVKKACGEAVPKQGSCVAGQGATLAWMSPDELLVIVPHERLAATLESLQKALAKDHALLADVSDARASFRLSGKGCREVLAKVSPVDMHPSATGVGDFRRTTLGQVAGAFWMKAEDDIEIVCFRSVQDYAWTLLTTLSTAGTQARVFS